MEQSPLDALAERIARIGRRESETAPVVQPDAHQDSARLSSIVEKAIVAMDDTLRRNEDKTAQALESVAKWMERNDLTRAQNARSGYEDDKNHQAQHEAALTRTMTLMVNRLDELDAKIAQQNSPAATGLRDMLVKIETRLDTIAKVEPQIRNAQKVERSLSELDGRLSDISRQLEPETLQPMRPRFVRERLPQAQMMADIAARQGALDENPTRQKLQALGAKLDGVKLDNVQAQPLIDAKAFETLRQDIAKLNEKINQSAHNQSGNAGDNQAIIGLKNEVQQMSRALNNLAPREQVGSIETAIQNLVAKVETSHNVTLREASKSAQVSSDDIDKKFKVIASKLDEVGPTQNMELLEQTIHSIKQKLDLLSTNSIDKSVIKQLYQQTENINDQLSQAAAKPNPMDGIEDRLANLAAKLEHSSLQPAPVAAGFDDLSTRIERIQSSINMLSSKKIVEPQSLDVGHIEEMVLKLNSKIDAIADKAPDVKSFEKAIRSLEVKLDVAQSAPVPNEQEISRIIRTLEDKIDAVSINAKPHQEFENLIRTVEDKISTIQTQSANTTHIGEMMHDISRQNEQEISRIMRTLEDKINAIQTQAVNTTHIGEMMHDISRQMEKAQRPEASDEVLDALQTQVSRLSAKLDKNDDHFTSLSSLEQTIGDIFSQLDSVKYASRDAAENAAREAVRDAMVEFKPQSSQDNGHVKHLMDEFSSIRTIQDQADRRTQGTLEAVHETLEKIVERLGMLEGEVMNERTSASMQRVYSDTNQPIAIAQKIPFQEPFYEDQYSSTTPVDVPFMTQILPSPTPQVNVPYRSHDALKSNTDYEIPGNSLPELEAQKTTQHATPSFSSNLDDDLLLDPDLPLNPGMPRPTPSIKINSEERVQTAKSSFIAAARKAAQAASEDAAQALSAVKNTSMEQLGNAEGVKQAFSARIKSIAGYRKPILLGLAAIAVLAGGANIYKNLKTPSSSNNYAANINIGPVAPAQELIQKELIQIPTNNQPAAVNVPTITPVAPVADKPPRTSQAESLAADPIQVGTIPSKNIPAMARQMTSNGILPIQPTMRVTNTTPQASSLDDVRALAEQGDARAQYELGSRYVDGLSLPRDPKLAAQWLEKAAAQGLAPAQYRLGSLYRDGKGIRNDSKLAYEWFKRAAEQGNARAMHNLAVVLSEGVNGTPDYASAAQWFEKSAEYGIKDSQFNIAILYARGLGVNQDLVQSYKWFAIAAMLGDNDAGKKRDEVGTKLLPEQLLNAKLVAQNYRPKILDAKANEVQPATGAHNGVSMTGTKVNNG